MADKCVAELDDVALAASTSITWRLQTGVQPYATVMSVHKSRWGPLRDKMRAGASLDLRITDSRGRTFRAKQLSILHLAPSPKPSLVSFVVADRRWKWPYKLIARDYNVPKKTGDRTAFGDVPIETQVVVDQYQYRRSSLNSAGNKWTARAAITDILDQLVGSDWQVDSLPYGDGPSSEQGLSVQNLVLRDQGDAALGRMLSQVPGAEVFVNADGQVIVFNGLDLSASKNQANTLRPTWDGDKPELIDRRAIRPTRVLVHYQREVEVVFEHEDNYDGTSANPLRDDPYMENVIPTVDKETEITEYDPETDQSYTKTVPAGTWVTMFQWLDAMDQIKPEGCFEWTFETIRRHWLTGDLDGVLGSRADDEERGNVSLRVQALKQHFRQTFRINRRYMERVRDIEAVRVALLDPVTGARAPAAVWGEACSIPTEKGKRMVARRGDAARGAHVYTNIDSLPPDNTDVIQMPPGPARVSIVDHDLGIIRIDWIVSPYGTIESYVPCHLVGDDEAKKSVVGDLAFQDSEAMAPGMIREGGSNGIYLAKRSRMLVMMTIVPAAPNNAKQFHRIEVSTADIKSKFESDVGIGGSHDGPDLYVFVPPGEATARLGWQYDAEAKQSVSRMLGLDSDNPIDAGLPPGEEEVPGFVLVNGQKDGNNELTAHSNAVAAEMLSAFVDTVQGRIAAVLPSQASGNAVQVVGNMASATVHVSAAPSGKVAVLHEFPGHGKPISRMALLPASVRHLMLGILEPKIGN